MNHVVIAKSHSDSSPSLSMPLNISINAAYAFSPPFFFLKDFCFSAYPDPFVHSAGVCTHRMRWCGHQW